MRYPICAIKIKKIIYKTLSLNEITKKKNEYSCVLDLVNNEICSSYICFPYLVICFLGLPQNLILVLL